MKLTYALCGVAVLAIAGWGSSPAIAQQKTVKACTDEWRSQKDAMKAAGTTEKAYVEKCRGDAAAAPAAAPTAAPTSASTAPAASPSGKKTTSACQEEWRSQKEAMQAAHKTEKAYVEECKSGTVSATPTAAPAAAPAAPAAPPVAAKPAAATPKPAPVVPAPTVAAKPATSGTPAGAGQFATEAEAKAQCPGDTVVWVNTSSKVYHFSGAKDYGTTKKGAYMCEKSTGAAGFRAAKNEKHP